MRAEADAAIIHNDGTATSEKELSSLLIDDTREPLRSITPNSVDGAGVEHLEELNDEHSDMAKKGKGKKKAAKGGKKTSKPKKTAAKELDADTQGSEEDAIYTMEILDYERAAASSPASDAAVEDLAKNQIDGTMNPC